MRIAEISISNEISLPRNSFSKTFHSDFHLLHLWCEEHARTGNELSHAEASLSCMNSRHCIVPRVFEMYTTSGKKLVRVVALYDETMVA